MGDINAGKVFAPGLLRPADLNQAFNDATIKPGAVTIEHLDSELNAAVGNIIKGTFLTLFKVGDFFPSDNDDLNERFGGTWARMSKGGFLLGSDADSDEPKYPVGATGGSETNTLTADQLPRHRHRMFNMTYDDGGYMLKNRPDAYASLYGGRQAPSYHDGDWLYDMNSGLGEPAYGWTGYAGGTKDDEGNVKDAASINNMPPYTATNWWKKVSDLPPDEFKEQYPDEYRKYFGDD